MDVLKIILGSIKGLAITALVPVVSSMNPAAGKALQDGADAFADGKLTLEEAEKLALDAVDLAASLLPAKANAFAALKVNIAEDIPTITNQLIPHFEATYKAFAE